MNGSAKRHANGSAVSPKTIADLSDATLLHIFSYVPTERNRCENRHALSLVCRRWRHVLGTPEAAPLWATIDATLPAKLSVFPLSAFYRWFLRHSGAIKSLTLEINSLDAWQPVHAVLGLSRDHLTSLRVFSDNDDNPCYERLSAAPWLALLPRLQSLELEGVVDVTIERARFPRGLTRLALNGCGLTGLTQVPPTLRMLPALRSLSLQFMDPGADFAGIKRLTGLQQLDLSNCGLRMVPEEVAMLPHLTALTLNNNEELGGLGNEDRVAVLASLKGLQFLEMRDCALKTVPGCITNLSSLRTLLLGYNDFSPDFSIPQGPYLASLELLAMSDCISEPVSMLDKVARPLAAATSLQVLRLNRNWGLTLATPVLATLLRGKPAFRKLEYSEDMAADLDLTLIKKKLPSITFKIVD